MALWQYSFFVLPKSTLASKCEFLKHDFENGFDDSVFWEGLNIQSDFFAHIKKILPQSKSWHKDILIYGNENSNDFHIIIAENIVNSVSFRIDFTSDYEFILREIIEFFLMKGLAIIDSNLIEVPLNYESIKNLIETSDNVNLYKKLSR